MHFAVFIPAMDLHLRVVFHDGFHLLPHVPVDVTLCTLTLACDRNSVSLPRALSFDYYNDIYDF